MHIARSASPSIFFAALIGALLTLPGAPPVTAQSVPATINYQGRLTDNSPSQTPVNAAVSMQFAIYDADSGGTRLWQEPAADATGTSVTVTGGIFNYMLGSTVPIPPAVFTGSGSTRYLQITINPAAGAEILAPRQRLGATAYANLAENANSAVSATTATTAVNSAYLGGLSAANYLLSFDTAYDSARLGGTLAGAYQKALSATACPANQFYSAIAADGNATCTAATVTETDPEVGALSDGWVPRWNTSAGQLENGTLYDNRANGNVGIGTASPVTQLHVAGRMAYAGAYSNSSLRPTSVFVQGRYAFMTETNLDDFRIFDFSNPASPVWVGATISGMNNPQSVFVQGRYAFVVNSGNNSLVILDISNPASPVNVGVSNVGLSSPLSVYVQGRYAYVVNSGNSALVIFDISNPQIPVNVGSTTAGLASPNSVQVQGRYAYVSNFNNSALVIFDIANPASPVMAGSTSAGLSGPRSVFVQGRYAYLTSSFGGFLGILAIIDISYPAGPVFAGSASTPFCTGPNSIFIQGRRAFMACGSNNSLAEFDITDPANPAYLGSSSTGLNTPVSVFVQGRHAFVASSNNGALVSFDLGGAYLQQLEAGGIETGTLSTQSHAQINGDAQVKGGLTVGSGIHSSGSISAASLSTPGPLSIGVRFVNCPIFAPIQDCSCAAGETVVNGGGYTTGAGNLLRESRPTGTATWRITCSNSSGTDINCGGMNIICDRRAP